ncbi:WXG100 family type VII secretion target [Micromonospora sp. LOL_023]|uniref:WXG100 family type VII secretion target n=1 Tax=Micromonospora sp. LOL_023 TaxID=3345418 RepID=UPI003A893205
MSQTQAEAAVMRQTAGRFEQVDAELDTMLRGLLHRLEAVQGAWRGAGGRSFEQVKTAWAQDQAALQAALRETAAAVRSAGVHYQSADLAAADRVAGAGRRIELPL